MKRTRPHVTDLGLHEWRRLPLMLPDIPWIIDGQSGVIAGEYAFRCTMCGLVCFSDGKTFPGSKCLVVRGSPEP